MNAMPVAALILAAGRSRRAGRDKLLARRPDGESMIAVAAAPILAAHAAGQIADVVVVLGPKGTDAAVSLPRQLWRPVVAENAAQGLSASLRAGIAALSPSAAIMVCLGDMPDLEPDLPARLIAALRESALPAPVAVPEHAGRIGNPVLWHPAHRPALLALTGDRGGRAILDAAGTTLLRVPAGPGVLTDYDTPERLARFERGESA